MSNVELISKTGTSYSLELANAHPSQERAYIFAFAKSGSTLINNMVSLYANNIGRPVLSLFNQAFDQGITTSDIAEDAREYIQRDGVIYTGFRHFPCFDFDIEGCKSILLVRDPRDMLVSLYYSITQSHAIPQKNISLANQRKVAQKKEIDDDVLIRAQWYVGQFGRYQQNLIDANLVTYRYEDVIYSKQEWLSHIVEFLELPYKKRLVTKVAKVFDVIPQQEMVTAHVRQVHPGNYKVKLKPETITKLNEILAEFLRCYKYSF